MKTVKDDLNNAKAKTKDTQPYLVNALTALQGGLNKRVHQMARKELRFCNPPSKPFKRRVLEYEKNRQILHFFLPFNI